MSGTFKSKLCQRVLPGQSGWGAGGYAEHSLDASSFEFLIKSRSSWCQALWHKEMSTTRVFWICSDDLQPDLSFWLYLTQTEDHLHAYSVSSMKKAAWS